MKFASRVVNYSTDHYKLVTAVMLAITVLLAALAVLPTLLPEQFSKLAKIHVDTDPENMLSREEPVRVFHNEMKTLFDLNDIVVVGVVNDTHPEGVFNPESLRKIHELTEFAKTLKGEAIGVADPQAGVVSVDIIAPGTVDNIEPGGLGSVRFEWLMPEPPKNAAEAVALREKAARLPFLNGTLLSEDGKALALYLPITSKDLSHRIYTRLQAKIAEFDGDEEFHITGLPVANDVFGVEMFKQMAISAPLAMLVIFLLMLAFFRKLSLIISPMIIALVSVIWTMALLIATGNTIHIMSSMIPIFIMPIAVLDSIHILSEFFDRYQESKDRRKAVKQVMETLFMPMLYTSLTSAAGFASLALTPIPPVQIFGIFVALGVGFAWLLTIVFIPAYIMFIPERRLASFGMSHDPAQEEEEAIHPNTASGRFLAWLGHLTYQRSKWVLAATGVIVILAGYGITQIRVNDNPTRWFKASHPIRVADRVLNEHFAGTYMAYLQLTAADISEKPEEYFIALRGRLEQFAADEAMESETSSVAEELLEFGRTQVAEASDGAALLEALEDYAVQQGESTSGDTTYAWEELQLFLDRERQREQVFKDPEVLRYMGTLQDALLDTGYVGKSNSLADIVKTVHRELFEGKEEYYSIPDTANGVAQTLVTYQSSHRPRDLWHFVTPDYRDSSLWVQLKSGDNRAMSSVVAALEDYVTENPPPAGMQVAWFGLTYINVVWQEKMVSGMLQAFLGSFLVVLLMMTVLFRSVLWGLLSMLPLTITIGLIYGLIGIVGKDYDMPVAVLSALTLGLAVDFAIHFLARTRSMQSRHGTWERTHIFVFGEPARAIFKNVIVIAVGFTPLLAAPLRPYITVGVFMALILLVSGATTLLLLPALIKLFEPLLFPKTRACSILCRTGTCVITGVLAIALVAVNIQQFLAAGWTTLTWVSLACLPFLLGFCGLMSYREKCRNADAAADEDASPENKQISAT